MNKKWVHDVNAQDMMISLRDFWSRTDKYTFLDIFFKGWDTSDPGQYYHDKWLIFRNSPLQFWCSCDDDKRAIFHKVLDGLSKQRNSQRLITEFNNTEDF